MALPDYDNLEPFEADEYPNSPTECNCGACLLHKPFYICVICTSVFCPAPSCGENHAYPKYRHYAS